MFRQFNFAFLLGVQIALFSHAPAQPSSPQRPNAQAQNRDLLVKEMRSGAALDGRGKLWAVVIGVSRYKNLAPKAQLEFAHRDAEAFAAFLRSPNGGGFPSSQLTLLTNQAATLSAVRSALGTTLPRSAEPDDVVVIFFAGHGVVEGERDGYLLAHDSDPQNLYATALQLSELNRIITERLKARTVILIADACHSGQLGWTSRGLADDIMINRFLEEIGKSGKGVFRLLASRQDQRSYEGKNWGGGHGVFTWFLLEGLAGKADSDKDGFVRVGELLNFLSEIVPPETLTLRCRWQCSAPPPGKLKMLSPSRRRRFQSSRAALALRIEPIKVRNPRLSWFHSRCVAPRDSQSISTNRFAGACGRAARW